MFFTRIATVMAVLICLVGGLEIYIGFLVADNPELAGRYYSSSVSSGEKIDGGIIKIFIGIAIGVVTEISRSLFRRAQSTSEEG